MSWEKSEIHESNYISKIWITLWELKKDVDITSSFREQISQKLGISLDQTKNSNFKNFSLGIIDWLMEFPAIIELYINNSQFREQFWITLKQISMRDFLNSIIDIWDELINGEAYKKWKSSVKVLLLSTGLVWLLRQFGCKILQQWATISIKKVSIASGALLTHAIAYAWDNHVKENYIRK